MCVYTYKSCHRKLEQLTLINNKIKAKKKKSKTINTTTHNYIAFQKKKKKVKSSGEKFESF